MPEKKKKKKKRKRNCIELNDKLRDRIGRTIKTLFLVNYPSVQVRAARIANCYFHATLRSYIFIAMQEGKFGWADGIGQPVTCVVKLRQDVRKRFYSLRESCVLHEEKVATQRCYAIFFSFSFSFLLFSM